MLERTPPEVLPSSVGQVTRAVADIVVGDLGDLQSLAASIAENGLLHPVVLTSDNKLIAGAPRLEACKALGWPADLRRWGYSHQNLLNLFNGGAVACFEHVSKARSVK